ncbi:ras guanine nucleotide exchange factor domain-containing protein [Multifurca ochricompacta]|uniref:Ras guanine nucleotide exchange factor domain-containing protein n=1 Tax=Multifurca ochricompacta TaxID=376703 RepID=A0AAD4MC99_9AGAM|nr:ras guanine nucleotide exchange factor domain-containing protein [Multifurca ochricompacta]
MSTSINSSAGLPDIPSLPPIEIPDTSTLRVSVDHLPPPDEDSRLHPHAFNSLSPSPYRQPAGSSNDTTQSSPTNASPLSPNLRKSFSVDSFSRHSRSSPVNIISRQNKPIATSTTVSTWQPQPVDSAQVSFLPRDPTFPLSGRSRGASISSTGDENGSSIPEEFDIEVVRDTPQSPTAAKRAVSKMKGKLRPTLPPGELPLPSKLYSANPTSVNASESNDNALRLPPTMARTLSHRVSKASPSSRQSHEDMTGIEYASNSSTSNTDFGGTIGFQSVTLAVVGEKGCGKSAAISKGLKSYKLMEPSTLTDSPEYGDLFHYTLREGKITDEQGADALLNVLEVDATILKARLESSHIMWPRRAPPLDGVIVCCDASRKDSFAGVEDTLPAFREARLPIIAFACKCDLDIILDLKMVHERLTKLDIGLVKVTISDEAGKNRLRLAFDWLLRAISHNRRTSHADAIDYQNPASPEVLTTPPPWEIPRSDLATPVAVMHMSSDLSQSPQSHDTHPVTHVHGPTSPAHAQPMGDSLASTTGATATRVSDHNMSQDIVDLEVKSGVNAVFLQTDIPAAELSGLNDSTEPTDDIPEDRPGIPERDGRYVPWATLDELLDKLLFLAVSGDDWGFISHFLLTYRRFASPRSVVLAMQKRMRQLDQSSDDPMFASFAQMRICHLLEVWIQDYPHDFAVGAAADALNALVKSIVTKTHLLHYGSELLPFLEGRPLHDKDFAWAVKVDEPAAESDDLYSFSEDDDDVVVPIPEAASSQTQRSEEASSTPSQPASSTRERKSSLPLSARSNGTITADHVDGVKEVLKNLLSTSAKLGGCEPLHVAEEITRVGKHLFLLIEPRDWLQHVLVSGKKDPESDSIARFNEVSEHLADWYGKQIEKLVEVAEKLRALNNYSALRAFVAGINNATYPGDPTIAKFQENNPKLHKHLQSWELLFNSTGSHRSYRMALRNSKGPCIPALEVHLSDLIRAHVGNGDFHSEDPSKVHWAKFNMMGKFVHLVKQYQLRCRNLEDGYSFEERLELRGILNVAIMDSEMQLSRIAPPPEGDEVNDRPYLPRTMSRDYPDRPNRDAALIRKLMFWV